MITSASYDVLSADLLQRLNLNTLESRRKKLKLSFLYKTLNEQAAPTLAKLFVKIKENENLSYILRNSATDLALPGPKRNFLKRSFGYSGAALWNSLPKEAKQASSLRLFKRSITSFCSWSGVVLFYTFQIYVCFYYYYRVFFISTNIKTIDVHITNNYHIFLYYATFGNQRTYIRM